MKKLVGSALLVGSVLYLQEGVRFIFFGKDISHSFIFLSSLVASIAFLTASINLFEKYHLIEKTIKTIEKFTEKVNTILSNATSVLSKQMGMTGKKKAYQHHFSEDTHEEADFDIPFFSTNVQHEKTVFQKNEKIKIGFKKINEKMYLKTTCSCGFEKEKKLENDLVEPEYTTCVSCGQEIDITFEF